MYYLYCSIWYIPIRSISNTMFAQRAMYYYLFYFLLHQLRIRPKDLEFIFLGLGIVYVFLYLIQFAVYPTILYDAYVRADRGTIRIYLSGSDYWAISFYMSVQYFLRTNKPKYLLLTLFFFILVILMGGRQNMAIVGFVVLLFLIIDKKVKSKLLLTMLGLTGTVLVFIIFQHIFEAIFLQTHTS